MDITARHSVRDDTVDRRVHAAELQVGHQLRTLDGKVATVTAVRNHVGAQTMRDLTVDTDHTYYVMAGNTPVLVHNTGPKTCGGEPGDSFRSDTRGPDEIFETGFEPRGSNMNLAEHVAGVSGVYMPPSGYLATTTSLAHAVSRGEYVYQIRGANGIDVKRLFLITYIAMRWRLRRQGRYQLNALLDTGCQMARFGRT